MMGYSPTYNLFWLYDMRKNIFVGVNICLKFNLRRKFSLYINFGKTYSAFNIILPEGQGKKVRS